MKPNGGDTTLGEEPGRTYGRDVHVYERKNVRGSSTLTNARSENEIVHVLYHELGHAIDDSLGVYSKNDTRLIELFQQDIADMPSDVKSRISYFTLPMEGCAEIVSGLLGGSQFENDSSNTLFVAGCHLMLD